MIFRMFFTVAALTVFVACSSTPSAAANCVGILCGVTTDARVLDDARALDDARVINVGSDAAAGPMPCRPVQGAVVLQTGVAATNATMSQEPEGSTTECTARIEDLRAIQTFNFMWVAPSDGVFLAHTAGTTGINPILTVLQPDAACRSLHIECADDLAQQRASDSLPIVASVSGLRAQDAQIAFQAVAGRTYVIAIGVNLSGGGSGTGTARVTIQPNV